MGRLPYLSLRFLAVLGCICCIVASCDRGVSWQLIPKQDCQPPDVSDWPIEGVSACLVVFWTGVGPTLSSLASVSTAGELSGYRLETSQSVDQSPMKLRLYVFRPGTSRSTQEAFCDQAKAAKEKDACAGSEECWFHYQMELQKEGAAGVVSTCQLIPKSPQVEPLTEPLRGELGPGEPAIALEAVKPLEPAIVDGGAFGEREPVLPEPSVREAPVEPHDTGVSQAPPSFCGMAQFPGYVNVSDVAAAGKQRVAVAGFATGSFQVMTTKSAMVTLEWKTGTANKKPFGFVGVLNTASMEWEWIHVLEDTVTNSASKWQAVAVDSKGNVYVAGTIDGAFQLQTAKGPRYYSNASSATDGVLFSYDPKGVGRWGVQIRSDGEIGITDLVVDAGDRLYISGHFKKSVQFGALSKRESLHSQPVKDGFIAQISTEEVWAWDKVFLNAKTNVPSSTCFPEALATHPSQVDWGVVATARLPKAESCQLGVGGALANGAMQAQDSLMLRLLVDGKEVDRQQLITSATSSSLSFQSAGVMASGDVLLGGSFTGNFVFGASGALKATWENLLLAQYAPSSAKAKQAYTLTHPRLANARVFDIVTSSTRHWFIGQYGGAPEISLKSGRITTLAAVPNGGSGLLIGELDGGGVLWAASVATGSAINAINAMAWLESDRQVVLAGYFSGMFDIKLPKGTSHGIAGYSNFLVVLCE